MTELISELIVSIVYIELFWLAQTSTLNELLLHVVIVAHHSHLHSDLQVIPIS